MTNNNSSNGFPTLQENSLILQKILENRDSKSTDKIYNFKTIKPRKYVKFINLDSPSYNTISKAQIIYHQLYPHYNINSKVPFNYHRYHRKNNIRNVSYNRDNQNIINPYKNNYIIRVNKNLKMPKYFKVSNHIKKIITRPEISNYTFSNSNINDSDNEMLTFSFNGNKIFANSFFGLNNDSIVVSPDKKNISNSNIPKGIELFRNYDELKKKKEEIIQRKMKRNLSPEIEENLKKEKNKDLKEKTINIQLQNFEPNNENEKKLIPLIKNKDGIFNKKKIKPRFFSNDTNPNNKQNNNNSNRIIINKPSQNKTNKINININNKANNSNKTAFSKEINQSNIIKVNNSTTDLKNNSNIIYTKKNYKANNIFISKYCSPQKITVNNKIKVNSETIRKKYENSENQNKEQRTYNIKTYSPYRPDILINPYRFIIPSKKFVEDYSNRTPTFLYSDDKKVCIKVHIIPNLEEIFLGRKKTKEKIRMQRVISIYFINENDIDNGLNLIRNKIKKNSKDLNNNALSSIKEEAEKSKVEPELLMKKDQSQIDIKINTKLEYKLGSESENISKIEKIDKKEEKIDINKKTDKNEDKNNINIKDISNKKENKNKEILSPTNNNYELANNKIKENNKKEKKKLDYEDELLKTEPKVETKRFFRRRFGKSNKNPEIKPEIKEREEKNEEKEQNKNQGQIKERSYRRIFERNKNTLKLDELNNNTDLKIEIKESLNNKRKYETLNKQTEPELLSSNSKKDIKKRYFLTKNLDKKEEKYLDEYENKFMKTEPIKVVDQKPNFRANFRRRFDKSKNEDISKNDIGNDEPKAETKEIDKNFRRRRFDKPKIESESQLIKNENKNDIKEKDNKNINNKIKRRFQYSNSENGNNIESIKKEEKIETNEIKSNVKNYRRRFEKDEPKPEHEIKKEINDEPKEKKNYEKGIGRRRFENQIYSENNSQLIKDEKKIGMNEKQNTESNVRKRYIRHFGNKQ